MKCHIRIQNRILNAKSNGFFLLLQVLFSAAVSAQVEVQVKVDKLTCDSIHFNADTTDIIFYKKQKNGVYDLQAHKMLIKPTKNPILMLFSADLYLQITKDGFQMDHFTDGINRFTYETDDLTGFKAVFPASISDQYKNVVELNGTMVNYENGEMIQTDSVFKSEFISETVFKLAILDENRVLINYARSPIEPLINNDYIYSIDTGFGQSGVFNKLTKKWEIPASYKSIEKRDSFLFCLNETANLIYTDLDFVGVFVSYERNYDVFVERNGEWVLKFSNLTGWTEENLKSIFGWDAAQFAADSLYIISEINGKKGLWQLELFHESEMNAPGSSLIYNQLLANEHDLIFWENTDRLLLSYQANADKGLTLYREVYADNGELKIDGMIHAGKSLVYGRGYFADTTVYADQGMLNYSEFIADGRSELTDRKTVRNLASLPEFFRACGLSIVNDSLIQVIDYKLDDMDPFTPPLKSYLYPDEDSIRFDESFGNWEAIYPPAIPGHSRSGVYNLKQNTWFIDPVYESIQFNDDQFLIKDNREDDGELERLNIIYSLQNLNGEFLFQARDLEEITVTFDFKNPIFLNQQQVRFYKQFSDKTIYNQISPDDIHADYYVQDVEGKWQIYNFLPSDFRLQTLPISAPKDLIHYCPIYDYFVYVESDSIFIEIKDQTHAMHSKDGFFEVEIQVFGDGFEYALRTIGSDTLTRATSSLFDSTYFSGRKASYQMSDHRFIINENFVFDNSYFVDWEIYWMDPEWQHGYKRYDSETAMIWQERNGVWEIKTPYYGKIEPTKLGYLVSTVSVQEFDKSTGASNTIPGRTILLDTNFKALSFLDYFDFESGVVYDFGVSLCNVGGCFLVGNNGEILTTAEWDYFELEDGRIKAVLYNYFLDEEYFYEEPGYAIEKVEYFDLPRE